jgi:RNA-directed DNA polymerase
MNLQDELSEHFGLDINDMARIISTAPARYKIYQIPKRRGGTRIIAQPSRDLKSIQRFIVQTKLSNLPVHQSATGYVKRKNILDNARAHQLNRVILKLDFENFFPSILVRDWSIFIKSRQSWCEFLRPDSQLYAKLLFWGIGSTTPRCLSIGAPSSPILSNILLYDLDKKFSEEASKLKLVYTRYADDITVSGSSTEDIRAFEAAARKIVRSTKSPKLRFNEEKRGLYLRGRRRMVTGLVITPIGDISIGRQRKRLISSLIHRSRMSDSDAILLGRLKGLLGFCLANEPSFVSRMRAKYGNEILDRVLSFRIPPR